MKKTTGLCLAAGVRDRSPCRPSFCLEWHRGKTVDSAMGTACHVTG